MDSKWIVKAHNKVECIQSIIGGTAQQGALHVRTIQAYVPAFATVASQSVFWGQSLRIKKVESENLESGIRNQATRIWSLESFTKA